MEIEILKAVIKTYSKLKAFVTLKVTTKNTLKKTYNAVKEIENMGSDNTDMS